MFTGTCDGTDNKLSCYYQSNTRAKKLTLKIQNMKNRSPFPRTLHIIGPIVHAVGLTVC